MYPMSDTQYQAVYNTLSFSLASMMATTVYLWFRSTAVRDKFRSAVLISGLVTFIAAYHYMRIFNSWVEAYKYSAGKPGPELTGVPFNDAYRYMDWLLTVPLLLIEILLVMNLDEATYNAKSKTLGVGSALMIVSGYYGELTVSGNLTPRWICWFVSMTFFLYPVALPRDSATALGRAPGGGAWRVLGGFFPSGPFGGLLGRLWALLARLAPSDAVSGVSGPS